MEQPKIEKILRLMRLMSGSSSFSIDDLARKLKTTPRTIYRYIDTMKDSGFAVEKVKGNIYRVIKMPSQFKNFDNLVYFSEEEAMLLVSLIQGLDTTNTLKAGLCRKLSAIYDSTSIKQFVDNGSNSVNIQSLGYAIREKQTVILRDYSSANSNSTRDRYVEPFAFTTNYIDVWAYDIEDHANKLFKIARIGNVDPIGEWKYEQEHDKGFLDVFRMNSFKQSHLRLEMNNRAKNLLCEEFPLAGKDVTGEDGKWILDTMVSCPEGAGRFIIGLMKDVRILDGDEVREYVRSYIGAECSKTVSSCGAPRIKKREADPF